MDDNEIALIEPKKSKVVQAQIVELRKKGYGISEIARMLGMKRPKVLQMYNLYMKEHEEELFSARIGKVVELDSIYPELLTISKEELDNAREAHIPNAIAGWVKVRSDLAREYREFLESIGFITPKMTEETLKHNNPTKESTDPILDLIKLNKIKLLEDVKKLKEGKNEPTGTTEVTI